MNEEEYKKKVIEWAREFYCSDELEIDTDTEVSIGDDGAWVHSWVWVNNSDIGIEDDD